MATIRKTITLTQQQNDWIAAQIAAGNYTNDSEAIRDTAQDEYGCDPALNWPGTSILSYPLTAISKRIERGETVDIKQLFEQACTTISDMAFSGRCI